MVDAFITIIIVSVGVAAAVAALMYGILAPKHAKKFRVFLKVGDVILEKYGKVIDNELKVGDDTLPLPERKYIMLSRKKRTFYPTVFFDKTAGKYIVIENDKGKPAPLSLLSNYALDKIVRTISKRRIERTSLLVGLLAGGLVFAVAFSVVMYAVVAPAESKARYAQTVLSDYYSIKSKYEKVIKDNEVLQKQVEEYNKTIQQLVSILEQHNISINLVTVPGG